MNFSLPNPHAVAACAFPSRCLALEWKLGWYHRRMPARFGSRFLIAFVALSSVAQQTNSGDLEGLLTDGVALSQQADYAHAIPVLERATRLAPRNYQANLILGVDLLRSGHPANALTPLRIAAEADVDETAEGYLGEAEKAQGEFALAAEAFETAAARSPASEQALVGWAEFSLERFRVLGLWLRSSDRGKAALLRVQAEGTPHGTPQREELLRHAAEADPEQPGIWGELGIAQAEIGKRTEAVASLKTASERQPDASSTLKLEALIAAAQGNWTEAENRLLALGNRSHVELQRTLAEWPQGLVPGHDVSGPIWQCLREQSTNCPVQPQTPKNGPTTNAAKLFAEGRWDQLAAMPPPAEGQASAWFWRGVALAEMGDCARAIPSLERGLKDGTELAGYWLIVCYGSEAGRTAAQLVAQSKQSAVHRIQGDILLSMKGDATGAEKEYAEALRLRPKDPNVLVKSAEAYMTLGDMDRARQTAQEVLTEDPHQQPALRLMVRIATNERDYPEALRVLAKLASMDPGDTWTRVQQAVAYAQTGHPEDAVRYLEPALRTGYPDEKGALHALLAGQLRKLGREQEAKSAADEALRLANTFQEHAQPNDDHK
jgi:tetratricopeptide (TPR) repeat protein